MSLRRIFLAGVLGMTLAGSAAAQSVEDQVVRQLQDLGYNGITISRTLLGRSRIKAQNSEGRREIVIDPRTGVILRDYIYVKRSDDTDTPRLLGGDNSGENGGANGGGNSGKGGGNGGGNGGGDNSGPGGGGGDDSGSGGGGGDDGDDD